MKPKSRQKRAGNAMGDWEKLLSAQVIIQDKFPECVLVGGTADADHVHPDLKRRFAEILRRVEAEAGWTTARVEPPVLLLGHFRGVRTGIRQLFRSKPLETTTIRGLCVPTVEEMLRSKAILIVRRNTTRDFIDFVALMDHLGMERCLRALESLDRLYPQTEKGAVRRQLALQLAEPKPWDLSQTDLRKYKALKEPYTDWKEIMRRAIAIAQRIVEG